MSGMSIREYARQRGLDASAIREEKSALEARVEAYELAEARRAAGITQRELAEAIGVSQKRISELEHGRTAKMQVGTLERYARGIGGKLSIVIEFPDKDGTGHVARIPLEA